MQSDLLPTLMVICYFDACQVVSAHPAAQTFPHEWKNVTVAPANLECWESAVAHAIALLP